MTRRRRSPATSQDNVRNVRKRRPASLAVLSAMQLGLPRVAREERGRGGRLWLRGRSAAVRGSPPAAAPAAAPALSPLHPPGPARPETPVRAYSPYMPGGAIISDVSEGACARAALRVRDCNLREMEQGAVAGDERPASDQTQTQAP